MADLSGAVGPRPLAATVPAPREWLTTPRATGLILGVLAAALVLWHPSLASLSVMERRVSAALALAIVLWMFEALEPHLVALVLIALLLFAGVPAETAFAGFAMSAFWLMIAALFLGYAMKKTGLALRIAVAVLGAFRPTYARLLFALFLIGTVLSLAIPSFTVRIAIMVPLAWSVVKRLRIPEKSAGSALVVVSAFEMAVLPGFATLTGSITGLLYQGLFQRLGLSIGWGEYAAAAFLPALVCSILVLGANLLFIRPGAPIEGTLRPDGAAPPISAAEKRTAGVALACLALWSTQKLHGLDEAAIAIAALVALAVLGVLDSTDFETGLSWRFVLFLGGIFSILKILPAYGLDQRLSSVIFSHLEPWVVNAFAALALASIAVLLLRFVETAGFLSDMIVFVALYRPLADRGVPPVVLAVATMFSIVPFWFLYQNFWGAMAHELSERRAVTNRLRLQMATVYAGAVVVSLMVGVLYWRATGLLPRIRF
jgi:di/tricarboxylate transporter